MKNRFLKILYLIIIVLAAMIVFMITSFIRRNSQGSRPAPFVSEPSEASSVSSVNSEPEGSIRILVGKSGNVTAVPLEEDTPVSLASGQDIIETDQTVILDTVMGDMQYLNQMDSHWGNYLISGKDPMSTNGCGPTCVSMLIHAFGNTSETVTPVTMADWAVANGQYVIGAGSEHTIIETALQSYGLSVTSLQNTISADRIISELNEGHILIGLMGPGYFTDAGHYLLMTGIDKDNNICIADPHSSENTSRTFTADFLIGELRKDAIDGGAPLWSVSVPTAQP